ncbi:AAA family ATPase [Deinococcus sp. Arct2-2]|uniref:AAA family ATPase n=1 Tax=Deinococcus sp. Arct2-2 TaxID=2568653 RepID=UPI0010A588B1|nr:AAA family ATPase [Deinococcus sp. Arct2-2]THF71498.1 AAA family ATPase [Deinococcus sp. Arct2-2]
MLIVHLLGHAHVTLARRTVPLSAKAVALIIYLYMEKQPQHRERLANLLWNTPEARKNLRVELARIRSAGLNVFPSSHQLLHLENVTSDFEMWCEGANRSMNQSQLTDWLAMIRGLPFTGLEDLGSSTFQSWVDQQRWLMTQQIEQHLSRMYWRYARENHTWATRLIAERAESLDLEHPGEVQEVTPVLASSAGSSLAPAPHPHERSVAVLPPPSSLQNTPLNLSPSLLHSPLPEPIQLQPTRSKIGAIHFERPHEEHELRQAFRRAEGQSQFVVLHGPPGSGKSHLAESVAQQLDWQEVRVSSLRSSRLMLASLAQALLKVCDSESAEALNRLLMQPATLEEDVVKVAHVLSKVHRPVLLIFDRPQDAPPELLPLFEFLFGASGDAQRVFLLLSREPADQVPLARAMRRATDRSSRLELGMPPLSTLSVQRTLEAQFPFEPVEHLQALAARLVQRSEGNPLHLLSLIDQTADLEQTGSPAFPQALRETFSHEVDHWPAPVREAVERLSVIYGQFDAALARAVLGESSSGNTELLLYEAIKHHILVEAEPEVPLHWPGCVPERAPIPAEPQYVFRSEGLRVTLASQLPQLLRQDIRRRLMSALAEDSPGLAAYYAARANLPEDAALLRGVYAQRLPTDSPLRHIPGQPSRRLPVPLADVPAEVGHSLSPLPDVPLSRQGYLLSGNRGGLTVLSSSRYGHPSTLTLRFDLPAGLSHVQSSVRLLWRLDVYGGGEELGPALTPFALRLGVQGSKVAQILIPYELGDYREEGVSHRVHSNVTLGSWMEHELTLDEPAARTLELSVRAVNVSLTVKALRLNEQNLLSY